MKSACVGAVVLLTSLIAPSARAQVTSDELRELRAEMQRLREEVAALRKELREGRGAQPASLVPAVLASGTAPSAPSLLLAPAPASVLSAREQEPDLSAQVEMMQSQIAELSQTKVESASRFPVRVFGAIATNLFANLPEDNRLNDPEFPTFAAATGGGITPFGVTMRQTRLGAILEGPTIGGMRSSAVVAMDFFTGPRLFYAFARLEGQRTAIQAGQDHILFAPQNPTSLAMMAFPQFFQSGNVYLRLPQFRIEHTRSIGDGSSWSIAGGVTAPREQQAYAPLQARTSFRTRRSDTNAMEVGASGYFGRRDSSAIPGDSWGFAVDFDARAGRFGLSGEMFVAQHLPQLGLASGQFGRSAGGFIEGRWQATPRLDFNAGFGTDRVFDFLGASTADSRRINTSAFGNFIYRFTPEFETSLEYRWLSTDPLAGSLRPNNHLNLVFVYRF